jgi:hypothetical protein
MIKMCQFFYRVKGRFSKDIVNVHPTVNTSILGLARILEVAPYGQVTELPMWRIGAVLPKGCCWDLIQKVGKVLSPSQGHYGFHSFPVVD